MRSITTTYHVQYLPVFGGEETHGMSDNARA
jgi:hypothetical protein